MKIERDAASLSGLQNEAIERANADARSSAAARNAGQSEDRLTLSPDAVLTREAIATAAALPEIRQDRVDQVRKLLDQGQVGHDPGRLADAMIDSLLEHPVDG